VRRNARTRSRRDESSSRADAASFGKANVTVRTYFSRWYYWAARDHRDRAASAEAAGFRGIDWKHRSDVLSSVLSSAFFIEAVVQEAYLDASTPMGGILAADSTIAAVDEARDDAATKARKIAEEAERAATRRRIANARQDELSVLPFARRILCAVHGRHVLDLGRNPAQNAQILLTVRNHLVHPQPADTGDGLASGASDERIDLVARKLQSDVALHPNIPTEHGNPLWPDRLFAASLATWAVKSAEAFAEEFSRQLAAAKLGRGPWWNTDVPTG
jgi:hypothetical protein